MQTKASLPIVHKSIHFMILSLLYELYSSNSSSIDLFSCTLLSLGHPCYNSPHSQHSIFQLDHYNAPCNLHLLKVERGLPRHTLCRFVLCIMVEVATLDDCIQCHQFSSSCSILKVNPGIVSPTLNVNPNVICHPLYFFPGDYRLKMLLLLSLTSQVIFHPNLNHPRQYFITYLFGCKITPNFASINGIRMTEE